MAVGVTPEQAPPVVRRPWLLRASWLFLLSGLASSTFVVLRVAEDPLAVAWLWVVVVLGLVFFRRRERAVFALAYGANLLAVAALLAQAGAAREDLLLVGNDIFFFERSRLIATELFGGDWTAFSRLGLYSGAGYTLVNALAFYAGGEYGGGTPAVLSVLNAGVGATIAIGVRRVMLMAPSLGPRMPDIVACAVAVYPTLLFYSGVGLRDIWVAAASGWALWALTMALTPGNRNRLRHLLVAAFAFGLVWLMRPVSVVPVAAFAGSLFYFRSRHRWATVLAGLVLAGAVGGEVWLERNLDRFSETADIYEDLSLSRAETSSLGARLLTLPVPLNHITRFLLAIVVPVPPPFTWAPMGMLLGLGALFWYLALPLAVAGWGFARRIPALRLYVLSATVFSLVLLASISQTSLDVRHKTAIIPFVVMLAVLGARSIGWQRTMARLVLTAIALCVLGVVYLILKGAV